ncbi:MAG TPA: GGDEF domain-containing protein [Terriglobia bacterium]|nr:GGDEF domain-containing protein [Terriglobia bacterium]
MKTKPELAERMGLQGRLQAELVRIELRNREIRWVAFFAAAVLLLGAYTLFAHAGFWLQETIEIKIPPQLFFLVMIAAIFLILYLARRELATRRLSLLTIQQTVAAESERSAGMFDAVTNVFSRRLLLELLQGEISRADRNHRPLALIMADLNNFKKVNDRYGHLVGDEVLAQTAAVLKGCVRGSDHVVRYGGDEFLLILSETDDPGARAVRARIEEKMAEWDHTERIGDVSVSLSLGLHLHVAGQSAEEAIAEVDARMYAEKQRIESLGH